MPFQMGLTFNTTGWEPQGLNNNVLVWHDAEGDGIGLFQFDLPPDIPAPLEDEASLHVLWPVGGSEALLRTVVELDEVLVVKSIVKQRQSPSGMMYIGSYLVPREAFSYVLKIQCTERGQTGIREAEIGKRALLSGQVAPSSDGSIIGWAINPDRIVAEPSMAVNIAEDESLDAEFPDHPLSRVRRKLQQIEPTIRIADFVKQAAPFTGSSVKAAPKPWWQRFKR
jgi:hypothetical protein